MYIVHIYIYIRLLSSSSYRITFEYFFIYILYKIVHNKLLHLFHYIKEIDMYLYIVL